MAEAETESGLSYWTKNVKDARDPVGKIKLSDLMNYDARATYKHKMLWEFHLGWSHADYEHTSLASVRKIRELLKERSPFGKTMSIQHINESNRDLCAWGYMRELEKGRGTKASRFLVNWDLLSLAASGGFPPSVNLQGDASEVAPSVHPIGDACVHPIGDASGGSVHPEGDKDLSTSTGLEDPVEGIDRLECAAPTAPLAVGVAATAAVAAQDEFEQLWNAYDYKKNKREARAAFKKLGPNPDLFATMMTAASAWRQSWAAQGDSKAPRFRLDKWLEREEYDCEPPTAYQPRERKAKPAADKPATKTKGRVTDQLRILEAEYIGSPFGDYRVRLKLDGPAGEQEHVLKILSASGPGEDSDVFRKIQQAFGSDADEWPGQRVRLEMDRLRVVDVISERAPDRVVTIEGPNVVDTGEEKIFVGKMVDGYGKPEGTIEIVYESEDEEEQAFGRKKLASLCRAVGLPRLSDTDEFLLKPILVTGGGEFKKTPDEMREAA
ncbi:hypothetical protein LB521_26860 [Mesorhizobium sp. BR-1-1-8]|uniref:hypothetical protein n=1 Tax=Mesorhizobium sp. BR-1-1-8 TaxID=2876659 RepID=UPI001CCAD5C2|nr:hypothetical protein [Mesorhizobium sp. BR-1-1-8]MBZ9984756.1 hypothetical protein [Mesorhizobium sp. BR-1-1-8]